MRTNGLGSNNTPWYTMVHHGVCGNVATGVLADWMQELSSDLRDHSTSEEELIRA